MQPFSLVFADPYGKGLGEEALQSARGGGWLAPGALCIFEESAAAAFRLGPGLVMLDERNYGDTTIRFIMSA